MANTIATLARTAQGYKGTLATLTLQAPIEFLPNAQKSKPNEPDFRIVATATGFEIGAAWIRQAKDSGEDYVSASLSAPEFNGVMYCNLAPAPGGKPGEHVLIWNRRR
jgi:uncharacterized protein (DUF736 family)